MTENSCSGIWGLLPKKKKKILWHFAFNHCILYTFFYYWDLNPNLNPKLWYPATFQIVMYRVGHGLNFNDYSFNSDSSFQFQFLMILDSDHFKYQNGNMWNIYIFLTIPGESECFDLVPINAWCSMPNLSYVFSTVIKTTYQASRVKKNKPDSQHAHILKS